MTLPGFLPDILVIVEVEKVLVVSVNVDVDLGTVRMRLLVMRMKDMIAEGREEGGYIGFFEMVDGGSV